MLLIVRIRLWDAPYKPVDLFHHGKVLLALAPVGRRTTQRQEPRLANHRQGMGGSTSVGLDRAPSIKNPSPSTTPRSSREAPLIVALVRGAAAASVPRRSPRAASWIVSGSGAQRSASSASVRSPRTAAKATFALNEGLWVMRVRRWVSSYRNKAVHKSRENCPINPNHLLYRSLKKPQHPKHRSLPLSGHTRRICLWLRLTRTRLRSRVMILIRPTITDLFVLWTCRLVAFGRDWKNWVSLITH